MNYPETTQKTVTPKKVFTNLTKKDGTTYKDGATLVVLKVHNTEDPNNDVSISGFCRPTDEVPVEGVQVTLDVYENQYGWQFIPNKAPTMSELNRKLDLVLSFMAKHQHTVSQKDQDILNAM